MLHQISFSKDRYAIFLDPKNGILHHSGCCRSKLDWKGGLQGFSLRKFLLGRMQAEAGFGKLLAGPCGNLVPSC